VDFRSREGDPGFSHPHGASAGCATVVIGRGNYICGAGDGLKGWYDLKKWVCLIHFPSILHHHTTQQ
jgi:hypothetical protein